MKQYTYLLGAGASAFAIPPVLDLPERIGKISAYLQNDVPGTPPPGTELEFHRMKKEFCQELDQLLQHLVDQASIDTMLRRLFLKESKEYFRIKNTFATYLTIENKISLGKYAALDVRYDSFLGNFLSKKGFLLPSNFRVLTWNYDLQWIKAASKYFDINEFNGLMLQLRLCANDIDCSYPERFGIFHLNGLAGYVSDPRKLPGKLSAYCQNLSEPLNCESLYQILDCHRSISKNKKSIPAICFVWDSGNYLSKQTIESAKKSTSSTDTLIVIGYSFPFYNRMHDRQLLSNMGLLKKIYIQDQDLAASSKVANKVKEVFDSDDKYQIIPVEGDRREFFIPNEIDFDC